jgi:hypothetical protein
MDAFLESVVKKVERQLFEASAAAADFARQQAAANKAAGGSSDSRSFGTPAAPPSLSVNNGAAIRFLSLSRSCFLSVHECLKLKFVCVSVECLRCGVLQFRWRRICEAGSGTSSASILPNPCLTCPNACCSSVKRLTRTFVGLCPHTVSGNKPWLQWPVVKLAR